MKKTNKKIVRKFAVALAAVMAMTTAGAIGASADNSVLNTVPKVKGWYTSIYDTDEFKELVRNDRLWQLHCLDNKEKTITIKNNGLFNVQNMKLYGREATGVDANGEFILGDWEQLNTAGNDMFIGTKRDITVNGKYVEFAFAYDITWGTDFPYSGVFWTNNYAYNDYDSIFINITGTCRNANIRIWVGDNKKVVDQSNCSAHSEWKP